LAKFHIVFIGASKRRNRYYCKQQRGLGLILVTQCRLLNGFPVRIFNTIVACRRRSSAIAVHVYTLRKLFLELNTWKMHVCYKLPSLQIGFLLDIDSSMSRILGDRFAHALYYSLYQAI
jgi:hypothetical protein